MAPTDSARSLPLAPASDVAVAAEPSKLELEVLTLFDEFRNPVLRYVLSFGISLQDGEEIVQEVFLALFRHLQLGKSRRNLRGWIFRVAHNLALKQRQANQKLRVTTETDWAAAERKADPALDPEQRLSLHQRWQRWLAVLQALPAADRSCLELRAEGLRYREIAGVLGISLGSVSISLTRSLARLMRVDGR